MLTAYDFPTGELLERNGVDLVLVGDSLGMVVLGYDSTGPVTMDEMIHHTKAVRRGAKKSFIIGDMPLKAVERGPREALKNARRFLKEGGADAVKVEWRPDALAITRLLHRHKIPVMGHLGLTPQTAGIFKVQGTAAETAVEVLQRAVRFEEEGVFSVLLECVPSPVGAAVTKTLRIPTIGIGAGPHCDGQVLVFHDLAGWFKKFKPRFAKMYVNADRLFGQAVQTYIREVKSGAFPSKAQSFSMKKEEFEKFIRRIDEKKDGLKDAD